MKKIVTIKNYGPFTNYQVNKSMWDGLLKKNNVIYAPNGSGKTSLSMIFESLRGGQKSLLISKKKSLFTDGQIEIKLIGKDDNLYEFKNNKWNRSFNEIAVFNSFYLENNVYSIYKDNANYCSLNTNQLFNLPDPLNELIKAEVRDADRRITQLNNEKAKYATKLTRKDYKNKKEKEILKSEIDKIEAERRPLLVSRKKIPSKYNRTEEIKEISLKFADSINKYLSLFTDYLEIVNIRPVFNSNSKFERATFDVKLRDKIIKIEDRTKASLKFYLSEGDKNTLALAFFLAKFDLINDASSYIVVIDDPFTSFDFSRKSMTIKEISRLSSKVKQLIVLTHDVHFANELIKVLPDNLSLQIKDFKRDKDFQEFNINQMMLTGLMKDVTQLNNYLDNGASDEFELLKIARAIRPTIEGIFRIKYFKYTQNNEWLGDFIQKIRNSESNSPFFRLKKLLSEFEDINDYSKGFHHSNSFIVENSINPQELKIYVKRTLSLIESI